MHHWGKILTIVQALCFCTWGSTQTLIPISNFGTNPGNLKMYTYIPSSAAGMTDLPLVVVLHGCSQTAQEFADQSGWNALAEAYSFALIYPEQKWVNNVNTCFNWFIDGDITRGQGEVASVYEMLNYMRSNYAIDTTRVYVTGLSAGASMSCALLACHPEVFSKGALMSGTPYMSASGLINPLWAMNPGVNQTPANWGDLVRSAFPAYTGGYPKVAVFQGQNDWVVSAMNQQEIVEQWTNVHGSDALEDLVSNAFMGNTDVSQKAFLNTSLDTVVLLYEVGNMGHGIAIDPGLGTFQGGSSGLYALDKDFFSSYWAADFFGLTSVEVGLFPIHVEPAVPFYPNPSIGLVYIPMSESVEVYSQLGEMCYRSDQPCFVVDMQNLSPGTYYIRRKKANGHWDSPWPVVKQ